MIATKVTYFFYEICVLRFYNLVYKIAAMATPEHPESYGWWINELESLGVIDAKRSDELDNDKAELRI